MPAPKSFEEFKKLIYEKYGDNIEILSYKSMHQKVKFKCKKHNKIIEKQGSLALKTYVCKECELENKAKNIFNKIKQNIGDNFEFDFNDLIGKNVNNKIKVRCKKHNKEYNVRIETLIKGNPIKICKKCYHEYLKTKYEKIFDILSEVTGKDINVISHKTIEIDDKKYDIEKCLMNCKVGDYTLSIDELKDFCIKFYGNNLQFDFSNMEKVNSSYVKVKCLKCGNTNQQRIFGLLSGSLKCENCYKVEMENKIKEILGERYDYSKLDFKGVKEKVVIICPIHGEFTKTVDEILNNKRGCPLCSKRPRYNTITYIQEAKRIHGDKFDYSLTKYVNDKTKITVKCNSCGTVFKVRPWAHLNSKNGCCPVCTNNKPLTTEEFIQKLKEKYGNKFDYSQVNYVNRKTPVKLKCLDCGYEFEKTPDALLYEKHGCPNCARKSIANSNKKSLKPNDHLSGYGCPRCGAISSFGEEEIIEFIKSIVPNVIIQRRLRNIISPYEIDIYLPQYKLAIEYNGLYWHSIGNDNVEKWSEIRNKHKRKTEMCEANGIRLLHIFENEWLNKKKRKIWQSIIKSKIGIYDRIIYARKCTVKELSVKSAKKFLEENHLSGYVQSKIKLGLFYNDELICVATFGKHRFKKQTVDYELYRFATKLNTLVIGGFSKLIKYFVNHYLDNNSNLYTYADRRISSKLSNVYEKSGLFKFIGKTDPNYWYFIKSKDLSEIELINRINFQKHKLKSLIENFDPNKTELENMLLNTDGKYRAIFDSGNLIYKLKK